MRRALRVAGFALLAGPLVSCGGASPTRLALTVSASAQLNPNTENQPSPTTITIYDLKSSDIFMSASFDDLFYRGATTLGGDMLAQRQITMLPGQTTTLADEAAAGTRFIGVVAGFRAAEGGEWRGLLAVRPEQRNRVAITLAPSAVTVARPPSGGLF